MRKLALTALTGALFGVGTLSPVAAHHSFAAVYDMNQPITVKGTIAQVRLTNPHSWFYIDVKNDAGAVERWAFEAGTPSGMIRNGYSQEAIPNGSEVTITGFRGRNEKENIGMLRQLTMADGKVFGLFGPQEGPAAR
jgi:DNA/RNA endonuclease YhcR with UshA esterase domain